MESLSAQKVTQMIRTEYEAWRDAGLRSDFPHERPPGCLTETRVGEELPPLLAAFRVHSSMAVLTVL